MKIAIVTERADIALGGAERSVRDLCGQLNRLGHQSVILAAAGDRQTEGLHILCPGQKSKRTSLETLQAALKKHLETHSYDLIHSTLPIRPADVYQPRGGSYKEAMLQNARSYPTRAGQWFKRTFHFLNARRTEMIRAEEKLIQTNPRVTVAALSEYVKRQFVQHYALPEDRIAVIANGVRIPEPVDPDSQRRLRGQFLAAAGLENFPQAPLFLFAAHNFRLKGLRELMYAFRQVDLVQDPYSGLIIAGAGPQRKFSKLACQLGIRNSLHFTGRMESISEAIAACDVVVLPTWYDPSSRVILEGLAMGKPVITTAFNGAAEFIRSGRHGIVIAHPRNITALAEAMAFYCRSKNRQQAQQAIAEDNLREKVSIARHAEQLISLYKRLLSQKNGTA